MRSLFYIGDLMFFKEETNASLPCIILKSIVMFPDRIHHYDTDDKRILNSVYSALKNDEKILLVRQKDILKDSADISNICSVGCVSQVLQVIDLGENRSRIIVKGISRANIIGVEEFDSNIRADVQFVDILDYDADPFFEKSLINYAKKLSSSYTMMYHKVHKDIVNAIDKMDDCGFFADYIASYLLQNPDNQQTILETFDPVKRLESAVAFLGSECEILSIEKEIDEKVKQAMEQNQRDFYLREKMHFISEELGDTESPYEEAEEFRDKIYDLKLDTEVSVKLFKEVDRLFKMPAGSHEAAVVRNYLETVVELPWNNKTKVKTDVISAKKQLDKDHYGLDKVKERILELIAVQQLNPSVKGQILCLVGPPGVGKTSIAKSLAKSMNRKYQRIALGGVHDEAEIRGHRRTYIGSMMGRIMSAINKSGVNNPLILLDEIDKLASDMKGDPASALLEALDPEQNCTFEDHYIDLPFDLSKVLFITTANNADMIPGPLLDRMEIIELPSYNRDEKFNIAKNHLVKRQIKENGLKSSQIKFDDSAIYELIDFYTKEAGVRKLDGAISSLCRKAAKSIIEGKFKSIKYTDKNISSFIGVRKFKPYEIVKDSKVGVVNGLAWTSVGGEILEIETAVMNGSGKVILTGSLGEVMKESANTAISVVRQLSSLLSEHNAEFYKNCDVHIHAPEGAVPKDGPSAGVTMTTALVSALTNIPVKNDITMTGEISLRGRVLAIGGLNEKAMAAYKSGINKIIIPKDNLPDISEIQPILREKIEFIPVSEIYEVLENALGNSPFISKK